jgi:anaerobic magnesium-protoporphyrin IX monomethyl ester cyclase
VRSIRIRGLKMVKVQLVRPPLDDWYVIGQLEDNTSYPIGLCLLAKTLKEKGIEVEILDGHKKSIEEVLSRVVSTDVVGVTSIYSNYRNALKVLDKAKQCGARTVIGGANVTHLGKQILKNRPFVDYAVKNDGEEALVEIVEGNAGIKTPNLVYRTEGRVCSSEVKRNAPLNSLFDLEDLVDERGWKPSSIPVSGIRGCVKAESEGPCDFCSIQHDLATMSPDLMWKQIDILHNAGFDYFWEVGESVYPKYLTRLLEARPEKLSHVKWKFYVCPHLINGDVAKTLRDLNTQEVQLGIETPNDSILQQVGKTSRSEDILRAVEAVLKNRINIHAAIMYGLTGETAESAKRTFEFARELVTKYPITKITTSHAVPFAGTAMFKRLAGNPEIASQYTGDLNKDDAFDYRQLTQLYLKHFTGVDFQTMDDYVNQTRALMNHRGYGTSFDVNPARKE